MSVIDADGHIIEPEAMFEHLAEVFYPRRPIPIHLPVDAVRGDFNGCWLIEGNAFQTLAAVDGPQLRCRGLRRRIRHRKKISRDPVTHDRAGEQQPGAGLSRAACAGHAEVVLMTRQQMRPNTLPEELAVDIGSAIARHERGRAGLLLESDPQWRRMSSDIIGNSLGED